MADGFFRNKQGYTVVQNVITRDKTISLKAKGLYLVIQSYITMPDVRWRKEQFMDMVPEGRKAFDSAWNELKEKGYLHIHIYSDGKKFTYEYELLNDPDVSAHTFYYNSKGEITRTVSVDNNPKEKISNSQEENAGTKSVDDFKEEDEDVSSDETENIRVSQNGTIGKGTFGNGTIGNGTIIKNNTLNINTKTINTNNINNTNLSNQSSESEIEDVKKTIRQNIEYDSLMLNFDPEKRKLYEEIYNLICDIVIVKRDTVKINSVNYPYDLVRERFMKLTSEHIDYVIDCLNGKCGKISNMRAYIITALYNSADTVQLSFEQDVRNMTGQRYVSDYEYANSMRKNV